MGSTTKRLLKRVASLMYSHRPGHVPDIFIHSTQRSGSTLLFDAVASQPGIKAVGEPLQERKQHVLATYLSNPKSRYPQLNKEESEKLIRYLKDLLAGRFVGGYERTYNPGSVRHHFSTHRNAVKILRTIGCTPFLAKSFPSATHLVLLRHPIPTVLSRSRNRWHAPVEDFVSDHIFLASLTKEQRLFVNRRAAGTQVERHLTVWLLEHYALFRNLPELQALKPRVIPILGFEHVVEYTRDAAAYLAEQLQLPDLNRFQRQLSLPSRSTRHSTHKTTTALLRGRQQEVLTRWLQEAPSDLLYATEEGLDVFGVDCYSTKDPWPQGLLSRPPWADRQSL